MSSAINYVSYTQPPLTQMQHVILSAMPWSQESCECALIFVYDTRFSAETDSNPTSCPATPQRPPGDCARYQMLNLRVPFDVTLARA